MSNDMSVDWLNENSCMFRPDENWNPVEMTHREAVDFIQSDRKRILRDEMGPFWISTVWLPIDHQYFAGPAIHFETMIFTHDSFDGAFDHYQERYSNIEDARAGHERAKQFVMSRVEKK